MEKSLQDRIGYHYKNEKLLAVALTHSSYANESKGKIVSNERLEFLGDAVLSIITADYLFHNFPDLPEGLPISLLEAMYVKKPCADLPGSLAWAGSSVWVRGSSILEAPNVLPFWRTPLKR